jgi:hypothetical protein
MIDKGMLYRQNFRGGGADMGGVADSKGNVGSSFGGGKDNREDRRSDQYGQARTTVQKGTLSDPEEKKDYFEQSYTGPGVFGGYRDTVIPNTTQYGNKSRLGSLIASGIGALVGVPGLGFLTNLTGPYNNRAFYDTKVVPAGKTNLDYDQYMAARMAGEIDAYGNPIGGGGDQGIQSLQYLYPTMSTISEVKNIIKKMLMH